MLFALILDHIGNVFLYFNLYGHEKLDLKFVHGSSERCAGSNKICPNKLHISDVEIAEENNRTASFGEKGLFIWGNIYSDEQLLPQINSCCQVVILNNEMTSPSSNHC